jgi:SHS2 domain-containing protein
VYHFLEDIAIADAAYEVHAASLPALFREAAEALLKIQVDNLEAVRRARVVRIQLVDEHLDMLLHAFLQELIYYKDAKRLLLAVERVEVEQGKDGIWRCEAEAAGEEIDPKRHELRADAKAVTMHRFEVVQAADGWKATVIVDI